MLESPPLVLSNRASSRLSAILPKAKMRSLTALVLSVAAGMVAAVPTPDLLNHTRPVVNLGYARVEGVLDETTG